MDLCKPIDSNRYANTKKETQEVNCEFQCDIHTNVVKKNCKRCENFKRLLFFSSP